LPWRHERQQYDVNPQKSHSGHYAAGEVIAQIVESMAMDRGMVFPLSICLNGEYGYHDICLALPSVVDRTGVRKIIELELNEKEKASLDTCAFIMRSQIRSLGGYISS
jgi:malate/lactate dehydrogenase